MPARAAAPVVHEEDRRTVDAVTVRRLRWSVDYGPDTTGWLLRPADVDPDRPLPGVLGLHCHGGVRSVGGEQLVDAGPGAGARAARLRTQWYDGRAPANDLARRGCAVLVHDTFSWASRRFDLSDPTPRLAAQIAAHEARWRELDEPPDDDERFDVLANLHEDTLAKAAGALGQTFAGLVLADDLVALEVLAADPGTDPDRLGSFGFSGGGGRSLLLAALDSRVRAAVVTCMMATSDSLVPAYLDSHSWLLHVPGLASWRDWPDLTALGRARFLVQYREGDELFPVAGMRAAHARLQELHARTDRYLGTFRAGEHAFDGPMQDEAWAFLGGAL